MIYPSMGRSGYEKSEGISPSALFLKIIELVILFIVINRSLFMCNSGFILASVRINLFDFIRFFSLLICFSFFKISIVILTCFKS